MSANVRDCPCTYSLLLGIIYMYKLPLSDLYSLFPYGQIKTQQQARPNKSAPLLYMGEMERIALTVAE